MTNKGKRLLAIDENSNHGAGRVLGKESDLKSRREIPSLRDIMFNSDVLRPLPNKEIASSREEGFFDARNEMVESDRTITHGYISEPNYAKQDKRVKVVRFADDEENHLLEWQDPANHHSNNVLRVLPQDPSGVLDIYHEAQDNPLHDSHEGSHNSYSREEFETWMYDDENSSCGYNSEEGILKYGVWGFLLGLGSIGIHKLVSAFRKSNDDVPANEGMATGREIIEDTTHIAELAADSAFNNSLNASLSSFTHIAEFAADSAFNNSLDASSSPLFTTSACASAPTSSTAGATTAATSSSGAATAALAQ